MNNVDISEALAWLVVFLGVWMTESIALHTLIEKVGVKSFLKQLETRFGLPDGTRQYVLPIGVFFVALYGIWTGEINIFVLLPVDIFRNAPEWMVWGINALVVTGGSFITHEWWERVIGVAGKAKELVDILQPGQDTARMAAESRAVK